MNGSILVSIWEKIWSVSNPRAHQIEEQFLLFCVEMTPNAYSSWAGIILNNSVLFYNLISNSTTEFLMC
jgi:hypothetical protein